MTSEAFSRALESVNHNEEAEDSPMDNITMTSLQAKIDEMTVVRDVRFSGLQHSIVAMNTYQEAMQANITQILHHLCHHSSSFGSSNP